jgi:hypothetical protein
LPSLRLTKTRFQETAINIRRERILRVQWGESVCGCTVKDLLPHSWTGMRRACCHHLPTLLRQGSGEGMARCGHVL